MLFHFKFQAKGAVAISAKTSISPHSTKKETDKVVHSNMLVSFELTNPSETKL